MAAFGALVALTDGVVSAAPDVFPWPAMPVAAWGVVRFTRRRRPYPAAVGLVAALQSATWAYAALG